MLKYSVSALRETLDFVKRLINISLIGIQLIYIAYIIYRLIVGSGNIFVSIFLLLISASYLVYQIVTTKEFYTKSQIAQKKTVKWIIKTARHAANIYLIVFALIQLSGGSADNESMTLLVTVLMIVGILFSVLFDIILLLVEKQIELIKSAALYDAEVFKSQHDIATAFLKSVGFDLRKEIPTIEDKKAIEKVKKVNYKQEQKKLRKDDFLAKHKHK